MSKQFSPEYSDKIDRQMNGLMFAMVELALAAHPKMEGDDSEFDYERIGRLLDAMPRNCPFPSSTVPRLIRQFDEDRRTTLRDVYDATCMRPRYPLYLQGVDDELAAEVFIGLAAQDPIHDNDIFRAEREEEKYYDDLFE